MARPRSPNRDKAFKIYKKYNGKITSSEIAKLLDEKLNNINSWRTQDKWRKKLNKVGAPFENQNAIGNKGGGAPKENQNNRKHGFYSKYLPKDTFNVFEEIETMQPLEILWNNIKLKFAAIIRAQKIMYVKDKDDLVKEVKKKKTFDSDKSNSTEDEWEIQFAWDRQANFLNAQSRAMGELRSMIKQYDEILHKDWDLVTEEQKQRIERLKTQIQNPDLVHRKEMDKKKLELERERFEHNKKQEELKNW